MITGSSRADVLKAFISPFEEKNTSVPKQVIFIRHDHYFAAACTRLRVAACTTRVHPNPIQPASSRSLSPPALLAALSTSRYQQFMIMQSFSTFSFKKCKTHIRIQQRPLILEMHL